MVRCMLREVNLHTKMMLKHASKRTARETEARARRVKQPHITPYKATPSPPGTCGPADASVYCQPVFDKGARKN